MKPKPKAKKVKLGDIVEIKVSTGLAYLHYVYDDPVFGELVAVLPNIFEERPSGFQTASPLYTVFFPVIAAARMGIVTVAGHVVVQEPSVRPLMRRRGAIAPGGKVLNWFITDGQQLWKRDRLSEAEKELSLEEMCNDTMLISMIEKGWRPRDTV